jgi:hypothetical protein
MVWVLFGRYMFSRGHNCFTNRLTTTLYDVKTTIYRTSSCPYMVSMVPIPQDRASHLVWVLFGRYMFSSTSACSAVFTKASGLLATTLYDFKTRIYRNGSCHHMVHLVPIPYERASHLALTLFRQYMFSGGWTVSKQVPNNSILHQNNNLPDQLLPPHVLPCSNTTRMCFPPGFGIVFACTSSPVVTTASGTGANNTISQQNNNLPDQLLPQHGLPYSNTTRMCFPPGFGIVSPVHLHRSSQQRPEPVPTTLFHNITTIYRTSSCHNMVYLVPIPQTSASRLVLELFFRVCIFTGRRNSVRNRCQQQYFTTKQQSTGPAHATTWSILVQNHKKVRPTRS